MDPESLGVKRFNVFGGGGIVTMIDPKTNKPEFSHFCVTEGKNLGLLREEYSNEGDTTMELLRTRGTANTRATKAHAKKFKDNKGYTKPFPFFWQPSEQETNPNGTTIKGGAQIVYLGHWKVDKFVKPKRSFMHDGVWRCHRIFLKFVQYDDEFENKIMLLRARRLEREDKKRKR